MQLVSIYVEDTTVLYGMDASRRHVPFNNAEWVAGIERGKKRA